MSSIKTKSLGTIVSFDPATQFAVVKLACNLVNPTADSNYRNVDGLTLVDVPVEFPRCGGFSLTFPVGPGDDCIVDFYESGITHWLYENRRDYKVVKGRPEAAAIRKFSRTDASCRVSLGNKATAIGGFNTDGLELRNADGSQKIVFHSSGQIELKTSANFVANVGGDYTVNAGGNYNVNATNINVEGSGTAKVKGGVSLTLAGAAVGFSQG